MGGPPDKWTKFKVTGDTSSAEVLATLNLLANEGFNSVAVALHCSDGLWVFVGGYGE